MFTDIEGWIAWIVCDKKLLVVNTLQTIETVSLLPFEMVIRNHVYIAEAAIGNHAYYTSKKEEKIA